MRSPFAPSRVRTTRHVMRVEALEGRALLADAGPMSSMMTAVSLATTPKLLDPLTQPRFVNPLPNPLGKSAVVSPDKNGQYQLGVFQVEQKLGLVDPATGKDLKTTVWAYGTKADKATYPGPTIVAQRDEAITVEWTNNLVDKKGNPLPHLLPVDTSIHWAFSAMDSQGSPVYPQDGVPLVTHLHGGHTSSSSDGLPEAWTTPNYDLNGKPLSTEEVGPKFNPVYRYDNTQEAATLWYHDHALGITRLNVYAGLAGFYLVRDANDTGVPDDPKTKVNENPSGLPAGPYEVPLLVQDRMFTADGQLYFPSAPPTPGAPSPSVLPEFFGDTILVNGEAWPVLDVEPREYRFRILNGSDSRFYNFTLDGGVPFYQVGTDDGLLPKPVKRASILLGPAERADIVIDFSDKALSGKTIVMRNNASTPFPTGDQVDPRTSGQIMAFRVSQKLDKKYPLTSAHASENLRLASGPIVPLQQNGATRQLILGEGTDKYGRTTPFLGTVKDGTLLWDAPITENPHLNDTEVWEIYNGTVDAHPIHLHLVSFQILGRQKFTADVTENPMPDGATGIKLSNIQKTGTAQPPQAYEKGWKDTVVVFPGEVVRIIAKFDRPGEYVWHCHILSHEDNEMMRPFFVGAIQPTISAMAMAAPVTTANAIAPLALALAPATSTSTATTGKLTSSTVAAPINATVARKPPNQ